MNGRWKRALRAGVVLGLVAALVGATTATSAPGERLPLSLCARDQNTFTINFDNPYFPVTVDQQSVFSAQEQGQTIGLQITVLDVTERFYMGRQRVTTRAIEELEWIDANENLVVDPDEDLIEVSRNYYAQTQDGTVCYFGEDVDIYENGEIVSHEGAWRADDSGHAPGIFMPAEPEEGITYQQEVAPGIAEDEATITRIGRTVTVPAGTFTDTLTVRDFNPLDGSRGTKMYAPDVGLVRDGPLDLVGYSAPLNS
jgi:hypothetical protein